MCVKPCLLGPLSRRVDERVLLVLVGAVPMLLGRLVMLPVPGTSHPPVDCLSNCSWVANFPGCDLPPEQQDNNLVRDNLAVTMLIGLMGFDWVMIQIRESVYCENQTI